MSVKNRSNVALIGDDGLKAMLKGLPEATYRKVLRPAMNTAAGFVVKAAKASASLHADTRAYMKSIGKKSVTYPKTKVVAAIVGARRGKEFTKYDKYGRKRSPAFYAHLVEAGAKPHQVTVRRSAKGILRKAADRRIVSKEKIRLPGAKGRYVLRKAWAASKDHALAIIKDEMARRAPIEAKKLAAKKAAKSK